MSQAKNFVVATNGRIPNKNALTHEGAREKSKDEWELRDGSKVKIRWVTGLNAPSEYQVEEI
jgi:hypothetical protein